MDLLHAPAFGRKLMDLDVMAVINWRMAFARSLSIAEGRRLADRVRRLADCVRLSADCVRRLADCVRLSADRVRLTAIC